MHYNCRCEIKALRSVKAGNATKNGNDGADYWIKCFGELPGYYVTKDFAYSVGWRDGKSLSKYAFGKRIFGGIYNNTNGHLPDAPGRIWYEADINYYEGKRNCHRLLWSNYGFDVRYIRPNKKDRTMCGLFVSAGTSAQFSHLRHRIAVTESGCYLSQTKQSGELFCRSDTMRQRQLPTTYSKSQVRAARTSQSPFCHFVTFPLSGESLFEAPAVLMSLKNAINT